MRLALLPLLLILAGCAGTGPLAALEGHEGAHGPPWAANEVPWVPPPPMTALPPTALDYPWWPGVGVGVGFIGRPVLLHRHGGGMHHRGGVRAGGRRR